MPLRQRNKDKNHIIETWGERIREREEERERERETDKRSDKNQRVMLRVW